MLAEKDSVRIGLKMIRLSSVIILSLACHLGCDIPISEEDLEKAIQAKERAEELAEQAQVAAEQAKSAAEQAKTDLEAERNAVKRLYIE